MPLKVSDGMSAWIKDFKKSDAPQFKGKSAEERREMAVAAYLSAKRGPEKENVSEARAPRMKYALVGARDMKIYATNSDERDARMDRRSLEKRFKQPMKIARLKTAQTIGDKVDKSQIKEGSQQENSDAVKAFLAKGGKIKRLPPGKAQGYHGKDDPAKGVHGMLNRPDSKRMGTRKKVRSMESVNEEMMFKVNVEGLPPMIMLGKSPADIKGQLRKIVKQPSMIGDIDRMTKAEVKKRYRDMGAGKGDDEEA